MHDSWYILQSRVFWEFSDNNIFEFHGNRAILSKTAPTMQQKQAEQ